jgi:hypothetical protein
MPKPALVPSSQPSGGPAEGKNGLSPVARPYLPADCTDLTASVVEAALAHQAQSGVDGDFY